MKILDEELLALIMREAADSLDPPRIPIHHFTRLAELCEEFLDRVKTGQQYEASGAMVQMRNRMNDISSDVAILKDTLLKLGKKKRR